MKKLITTVAMSLLSIIAMAQPEKGAIVLFGGAGLNFSTNTVERDLGTSTLITETKTTNSNLNLGAGYFVTENISLMAGVNLNSSTTKVGGEKTQSNFLGGGMVGARYYHPCFAPRFYTYGELSAAFSGGNSRTFDPATGDQTNRDNLSNVAVGLNPGFAFFLSPAVALEMSFGLLGWSHNVREDDSNPNNRVTDSDFDLFLDSKALTLGFCWFIGRKDRTFPPAS